MGTDRRISEVKREILNLKRDVKKTTDYIQSNGYDDTEIRAELNNKQPKGNYALKSDIPKNISNFVNDKGYLTEHQDISGKADKTEIPTNLSQLTDDLGNTPVHTHNQYLTEHQSLNDYVTRQELNASNVVTNSLVTDVENLKQKVEVPIGAIIQSPIDITSENFKKCDGSLFNPEDYPNLSVNKVKFYRLCNLTRSTYDANGNITFKFFHNDLWTTDPNICKKKNPDLNNLYRRLRYLDKDTPAVAGIPASSSLTDAIRGSGVPNIAYGTFNFKRFINIQEDVTMINGVVTSESGFYDGKYCVELEEYEETNIVEGNGWYYYNNYDLKDIKGISDTKITEHSDGGGYYIEGAQHKTPKLYGQSAAESDRKISDNCWLTSVTDGKLFNFFDGVDTATTQYVTNKTALSNFYMEFDFITPPSFDSVTDIFYSYRSLVLRIQTDGKLNIYMAGYNSSGLKWRVSNKFTGFTLEPNRRYHLYIHGNIYETTPFSYYMSVFEYNEKETSVTKLECDSTGVFYSVLESNYHPYNYYNSTGIRGIYCADANAWNEGYFFDLLSLRIKKYDGSVSYTNYGGEFRVAKLSYQEPSDNGLALPRITGNDGGEYYIRVK